MKVDIVDLFFENILNMLPLLAGAILGAILEHLGLLAWLWGAG